MSYKINLPKIDGNEIKKVADQVTETYFPCYDSGELFPYELLSLPFSSSSTRYNKKVKVKLWPSTIIRYKMEPNLPGLYVRSVSEALYEFHLHTCLKFKIARWYHKDYIYFKYIKVGDDCGLTQRGFTSGKHIVGLNQPFFGNKLAVMRLVLYILGFWLENNRPDRDNYVKINYENIQRGAEKYFMKYSEVEVDTLGLEYDFNSILHYSPTVFSKNQLPTIEPKIKKKEIVHGNSFSKIDKTKIALLYCSDKKMRSYYLQSM